MVISAQTKQNITIVIHKIWVMKIKGKKKVYFEKY